MFNQRVLTHAARVREERGGDGGGREDVRAVPCGVLLLRRVPEGALEGAQEDGVQAVGHVPAGIEGREKRLFLGERWENLSRTGYISIYT